jgi:diguanylate cyclase (GGDEF)-like protein/PAS domain S-box-containing protein
MRPDLTAEAPVGPSLSTELIDAAFRATPNGVVIQDPSGVIVTANRAAEHILGVTNAEMRGRTSHDHRWRTIHADGTLFPGETHPSMIALQTGQPVRGVVMGVHTPDAGLRWLRVDSTPLAVEDVVEGVATIFVDITEQRRAEDGRREAEGRLKIATNAGRVGVFEWDPVDETIWVDDEAARICGCHELSKRGPLDVLLTAVHREDRSRAERQMREAFTNGGPSGGAFRVVHPDGAVRFVIVQAEVRSDTDGSSRLTGAIVDVTDLHGANQRVVDLLESMPEAYLSMDRDYRFTYLNPAAEALLDRDRTDLAGHILWREFGDLIGSQFEGLYRTVMDTGCPGELEAYYPPHCRWYEVHAHPTPEGLAAFFRDVTDRHTASAERDRLLQAERAARVLAEQAHSELAFRAAHDSLTGLPNRDNLHAWITDRLRLKAPTSALGVCYLDLDRFKRVNDSWGHSKGDRLLVEVADRLRRALRPEDLLARLGGDEFVVVLEGTGEADLMPLADRLLAALRSPFDLGGRQIVMTASIGLVFADAHGDAESLIRDADAALFRAKDTGRDRIVVFDDQMRAAALARIETEADLRDALSHGELFTHYQPTFCLSTGAVLGLEALTRWTHPRHGAIPPSRFIPVASETGLITALTSRVLEQAAQDATTAATITGNPEVVMWVNATPQQLTERCFADAVLGALDEHGLPGQRLGIEVVEAALLDESDDVATTLRRLASNGVPIAIDDFGTGHSSLHRLHEYPVDLLKIDQSFVARLTDPTARPIVAAIVHLAHAVGAKTCAEGIETEEQLQLVRELGVDWASGFHLAAPDRLANLWRRHGAEAHTDTVVQGLTRTQRGSGRAAGAQP